MSCIPVFSAQANLYVTDARMSIGELDGDCDKKISENGESIIPNDREVLL